MRRGKVAELRPRSEVAAVPDAWGIDHRYIDAADREQRVPRASIERLREIIGDPPDDRPAVRVVRRGDPTRLGPGEIALEDGGVVEIRGSLPPDLPFGYHVFTDTHGNAIRIISTPGRCHLPRGWRAWGWAAQLYAARSTDSWGIGDLADLRRLARWSARLGAGFVLVNPLGATAPVTPQQPSPYYPASRRFRSPLYLRVEEVPGVASCAAEVTEAAAAGRRLDSERTIDRDEVWRLKLGALERIWDSGPPLDEFEAWYASRRTEIEPYATWSVLVERHGPDWRDWPAECRSPEGDGASAAVAEHPDRVRFHAWLQWLLDRQLAAAADDIAIVQDLPIGVDPGGFDAWTWQEVLALDASVGAPPDEFSSHGQSWGLPPFIPHRLAAMGYEPFVATIRASLAAGGGLRIDHVMGLFRLWWIPAGGTPGDGAYVRYRADDLLGIVALESHRAGAVIIGEDLGTVEPGVRERLAEHDILSYRLLWFERDDPSTWPPRSMAAITTHDLPTVTGLWDGSDLATQQRLGLDPNAAGTAAMRSRGARAAGWDESAPVDEAVVAAHRLLARSPSVLVSATLDDAIGEPERPNIPGADARRPNWSLALPLHLEEIEAHPLAHRVAGVLDASVRDHADRPRRSGPAGRR